VGPVFVDRRHPPEEGSVHAVLGAAAVLWDAAHDRIVAEHGPIEEQWAWSGSKAGWTLRLARRGRPVAYLTPWNGQCRASLALGERALAAAREELEGAVLELVDAAPTYPEGRAIRLILRTPEDVEAFARLVSIRMAAP
jgi:antitoxin (DNA-binding transcriptional repressor) of toxin-antitoxin stability system